MGKAKKIIDTVEGLPKVKVEDLHEFQGELKRLSPKGLERLKTQLIRHNFFAPIYVWKSRAGIYHILDGHQRIRALEELREEGYQVPDRLSVLIIKTQTRKDAAAKVLAFSSQYAKVTKGGLEKFLDETSLEIEVLSDEIEITGLSIELDEDVSIDFGDEPETAAAASKIVHKCPECGYSWKA